MPGSGRALVSGAAGFLGSHLVRSLLACGHEVVAMVRPGSEAHRLTGLGDGITAIAADVADYPSVLSAFRAAQPETVFHLAGDTSVRRFDGSWDVIDRAIHVNLHGTLNLVRAAVESGSPVRSFVRAGGLEEYGFGRAPGDEAQRERPSSPYSASQVAATHWCQMLQGHLPFALTSLRPALVYGPSQSPSFLVPALIVSLLRDERFAVTDGLQTRDYIHVDDVVRAFRLASSMPDLRGAVINIASGEQYRIVDIARLIAERLGKTDLLDVGGAARRPGDLQDVSGERGLAERLLAWRPEIELGDGLSRTIEWYRSATTRKIGD